MRELTPAITRMFQRANAMGLLSANMLPRFLVCHDMTAPAPINSTWWQEGGGGHDEGVRGLGLTKVAALALRVSPIQHHSFPSLLFDTLPRPTHHLTL